MLRRGLYRYRYPSPRIRPYFLPSIIPLAQLGASRLLYRAAALRLFPNLLAPLPLPPPLPLPVGPDPRPFIRLAENPRISAVEAASPLFAKRFLPPKPNFWSFFCRLDAGPEPLSRPCRSVLGPSSTSMFSKRSSPSLTRPVSCPLRSEWLIYSLALFLLIKSRAKHV